ncbi:MAG: NifB/NifX family molybdenum-iron cluster-binding protein [Verrucomicrobiota bacterium]|nr:NifB/NifX family molybdenum-iron cluster-binding protein [Verrucomicrobiota bacterium]
MKIAITAQGKDLDSKIDLRFGRTKYFLLIDTETEEFEVLDNKQNLNAAQGAGIQAGQTIIDSKAEALVSGNCGPKAFTVLNAGKVKIYTVKDMTVKEALDKFNAGELEITDSANVDAHWV